jgi:hypothetical protein
MWRGPRGFLPLRDNLLGQSPGKKLVIFTLGIANHLHRFGHASPLGLKHPLHLGDDPHWMVNTAQPQRYVVDPAALLQVRNCPRGLLAFGSAFKNLRYSK